MDFEKINWHKDYHKFIEYLKSVREESYKEFSEKITFTKYEILGIRLPKLRSIAKEIKKGDYRTFLNRK